MGVLGRKWADTLTLLGDGLLKTQVFQPVAARPKVVGVCSVHRLAHDEQETHAAKCLAQSTERVLVFEVVAGLFTSQPRFIFTKELRIVR